MDILKSNKYTTIFLFIFLLVSCKETHRKPIHYCEKYISGAMYFNIVINDVTVADFEKIEIESREKGTLKYFKKAPENRFISIEDTLGLSDTILINLANETLKLYNFENGDLETTLWEGGDFYENCFLKQFICNGDMVTANEYGWFEI